MFPMQFFTDCLESFALLNKFSKNNLLLFSTLIPQFNLEHPLKAFAPTPVTHIGILIHVRLEQLSNALEEIYEIESEGINIDTKFVHERKAPSLMKRVSPGSENEVTSDAGGNRTKEIKSYVNRAPVITL